MDKKKIGKKHSQTFIITGGNIRTESLRHPLFIFYF